MFRWWIFSLLVWKCVYFTSFMKDVNIRSQHLFSFGILKMLLYCLLASTLYDKKSTVSLAVAPLIVTFISLATFKILSLHWIFPLYYYMYSCRFLFILLKVIGTSKLCDLIFLISILSHYFLNIVFSWFCLSSSSRASIVPMLYILIVFSVS